MNVNDDFELRRRLGALAGDRLPVGDLWPGIEARLAPRRSRRTVPAWSYALAAGVMLAIGIAVLPRLDTSSQAHESAAVEAADARAADPADGLLAAYAQVLAAEQTEGAELAHRMSAAGSAERLAAARELDASLAQLAAALRVEPGSQLLRRLMHQTLQQRAALTLEALGA